MGETERTITEAKRLNQFASFFKNYMGVSSVVVAALPIPATLLGFIPVHAPDKGSLSVITSLTCFLVLAAIFYSRHSIAKRLFRRHRVGLLYTLSSPGLLIALLILVSVGMFFLYMFEALALIPPSGHIELSVIGPEYRVRLMAEYTAFFAAAEAAFVLMATKEYLQDLVNLSEHDLILSDDPLEILWLRRERAAISEDGGTGDEAISADPAA